MKQSLYKSIIIIISILVLWLCAIPYLFSCALPVICENISYNTDYKIEIKNPRLYLNIIPTAVIKAQSVEVSSKTSSDKYSASDIRIKIRILPLFSGRVHINKIQAADLKVKTVTNKNIRLDKNFLSKLCNSSVRFDCIDLKHAEFDLSIKNNTQKFLYRLSDVYYKRNGRYLKLNINSKININGNLSAANASIYLPKNNDFNKSIIAIQFTNFDVSKLTDFLKNYLPSDLVEARGLIDVSIDKQNLTATFKNFGIIIRDDAKSIIFPKELNVNSGFVLTRKSIYIDNAKILSDNINTVINGKITNYIGKIPPEINLDVLINKSKIEDFINMLPSFRTEDIDVYNLKKFKLFGDIIGNLSIKGGLKEPSVYGDIFINNGVLIKPIEGAKGAVVKLIFKGKYLNFDVTVPAGSKEKVWVQGGVELYNVKYADMHVWSTQNVDLTITESKVVPLHKILNFIIGPVPIMDIKGIGNIDITIKGNRKNPHIWGVLNLNNVTTHFYEMQDLVLTKAFAVLNFEDEKAFFKLNKGILNGKDIDISGICTMSGKFDFNIVSNSQKLEDLHNALKNSTLVDGIKNMVTLINDASGLANLKLNVYGNIKDIYETKFNENFFIRGTIELLGNLIELNGLTINNANGTVNIDNTNADIDISSYIGKSPLSIRANVNGNFVDANIVAPRLNLRDILSRNDKFLYDIADIFVNVSAKYKGRTDEIEYNKIDFSGQVINVSPTNKLKLSNGKIAMKNGKLQIRDMNGFFEDVKSSFNIDLQIEDITKHPVFNGNIQLKDFELYLINLFGDNELIPENIRKIINSVHFNKGKINLKARVVNNNVNASTDIGGIELTYVPLKLPLKIINGSLYIRKNYLGLNKINLMAEDMPVLIDGGISNLFTKQDFNLYVNSKPRQDFIDKYINNNRIYPLKIKGDIVYWLKLKGIRDNFDIESEVNLAKESNIYYLGATIGDIENSIIMNLNMNVSAQKILKIKDFSYDKLIDSQGKRQTRLNMLKSRGEIDIEQNDLLFNDLRVKTGHPTDARIFNILFRKPNIKQGQFTSDLRFNGKLSNPKLTGTFKIVEANIPFLDTTMKTLSLNFKEKIIEMASTGEIFGNDIKFKGVFRNKLSAPYYIESAELYTNALDLNYMTNKLKSVQVSETNALDTLSNFDIKNTVIKNLKLYANEIKLRNLSAGSVEALISISEKKIFNIEDFRFIVANGIVDGKFSYNMLNSNTNLILKAKDINANDMAIALFDLKGQIYGDLTGNLKLSCNGKEFNKCMETLDGSMLFDVKNGKMPKLGSLEYLLKAGNLVKGGLTGLSINSVIDILSPLKTGEFAEIYGKVNISNGVADDIEISSRGKDLSIFLTGKYNFGTSVAEMEVLGLLSKKISTMFGPIGNMSLNTLFNVVPGVDLSKDSKLLKKINRIPGIELNSKAFRKFIAEVDGDINGDNYVTSFRWIN